MIRILSILLIFFGFGFAGACGGDEKPASTGAEKSGDVTYT